MTPEERRAFALALDVLEQVVDQDPCRMDNNGQCQTHGPGGEVGGRCFNVVGLDLLDEHRPEWFE